MPRNFPDHDTHQCCRMALDEYEQRLWPIDGPAHVRCSCGRLWQYETNGHRVGWHLVFEPSTIPATPPVLPVPPVPPVHNTAWRCLVGVRGPVPGLSGDADFPMRQSIRSAFRRTTGVEPDYCFSGWGAVPTSEQQGVIDATIRTRARAESPIASATHDPDDLQASLDRIAHRARQSFDARAHDIREQAATQHAMTDYWSRRWETVPGAAPLPDLGAVYGWTDHTRMAYLSGIVERCDGRNVLIKDVQYDTLDFTPPLESVVVPPVSVARISSGSVAQPIQPLEYDPDGVVRFRRNSLVEYLLVNGGITMTELAAQNFPDEDRQQFAQLTGYSMAWYRILPYVTPAHSAVIAGLERAFYEESRRVLHDESPDTIGGGDIPFPPLPPLPPAVGGTAWVTRDTLPTASPDMIDDSTSAHARISDPNAAMRWSQEYQNIPTPFPGHTRTRVGRVAHDAQGLDGLCRRCGGRHSFDPSVPELNTQTYYLDLDLHNRRLSGTRCSLCGGSHSMQELEGYTRVHDHGGPDGSCTTCGERHFTPDERV